MQLFRLIWRIIPTNLLSIVIGKFFNLRISRYFITSYIKIFSVDVSIIPKPINKFSSLRDFFVREINLKFRPIAEGNNVIISPVDGRISAIGDTLEDKLLQVKNIDYSLEDLLGGTGPYISKFRHGKFVTIYLSPSDYHRIHMPITGTIVASTYIPGFLYPVNKRSVNALPNLFAINERLVTYIQTKYGHIALVKVGATNVGSIKVKYDSNIKTNTSGCRRKVCSMYESGIAFNKGDELAHFEFGSTVILLFEPGKVEWLIESIADQKLILGQGIAQYKP